MDADNENDSGKEQHIPGNNSGNGEQENSQGFSPKAAPEAEPPVRVLQLSPAFFVADTLEDNESMIVPPTQDMLIPCTPPLETSDKEGNISNGNNDTTLSNLDETNIGDVSKSEEKKDEELMDTGSQNDMTQDLPGLEETGKLLADEDTTPLLTNDDIDKEAGDDDWELRFSETQETQELLSTAKMRGLKEQEELTSTPTGSKKDDSTIEKELNVQKETEATKPESTDFAVPAPTDNADEKEDESEDEIEPSQSCLSENTYSAFRDQLTQIALDAHTAHSTPDNTLNAGKVCANTEPDALMVPSPILPRPAAAEETKPTTCDVLESVLPNTVQLDTELPSSPKTAELKAEETPILVPDTEPEQLDLATSEGDNESDPKCNIVCDTIELLSSVDNTMDLTQVATQKTDVKAEEEKTSETPAAEESVPELEKVDELKVSKESTGNEEPDSHVSLAECAEEVKKHEIDNLPDTLPMSMLPPLLTTSRLSRKQKFERTKRQSQTTSFCESSEKLVKSSIGNFRDIKALERIFNSFGILLENNCSEAMLSLKPSEELKLKKTLEFTVKDNKVFLVESVEVGAPNYHLRAAVSPHSGSSSSTTTSTVSTKTSLHSGEMADVSASSSSAKSLNSLSMQLDTTVHSTLSSQEHCQKTSTQNSEQFVNLGALFNQQKRDGSPHEEEVTLSPIKSSKKTTVAAPRKRGGRRTAKPNNKAPTPAKRKRGKAAPVEDVVDAAPEQDVATEESEASNQRPRKALRRKKADNNEPPAKLSSIKSGTDAGEVIATESSGDAYADSPYGSILPGVRVMARWKDSYYYPGMVHSQELEGRWSVRFDDGKTKAIAQENLIKVAILEKGTSVLVQSPDDYYDPGIVSGFFREGSNVGYDVELDSGVTRRYPRTSVILSSDQAKLLTSTRPPKTPATMTINLDNILDGKRKRKSIHSPEPNPVVKKSPRISQRIAKIDPHLDETEGSSSAAESRTSRLRKANETTETEEESTAKQRTTRKRKAAKTSAAKTTQALAQSAAKNTKLFKDYAFLLTNAERKTMPKLETSDSENFTEDDEIIPFNKDELVDYIVSRGGTILDKFEDVVKCAKKNIYLLANTYLRTMKYIQCVAAGICCIKHHWVQNCCFKSEILNLMSYQLPAGKLLTTNEIKEWHGKNDVLKGLKISLVSAPESPFVFTWAPVLLAAKADFVQKWSLPSAKSGCAYVDVLITDPHCPTDILQSARRRKIPTVSSEWVIQSLIAGKCLPYDAHPKFRHDFIE